MRNMKWSIICAVPVLVFALTLGCAKKASVKAQPMPTPSVAEEPTPPKAEVPPAPAPEPAPPRVTEREVPPVAAAPIRGLEDIRFDFDKYNVLPDARATLEHNARWLKENARAKVQIEGHCDERGTVEYNLALGERRAKSSRDYLISLGVEAHRLSMISYGEERPADPGHTEEAWAKNRRAHFLLLSE